MGPWYYEVVSFDGDYVNLRRTDIASDELNPVALALLPPEIVIHRLTGDGPRNLLLAPLWSTDKKRVLNTIQKCLRERDLWQGKNI